MPSVSPVGHWKMNDALANTDVVDSVGGNDGTLNGGDNTEDKSVAGKINTALDLDGSADYISLVASNTLIPNNDSWGIGLWFNAESISGSANGNRIITFYTSVGSTAISLELGSNNEIQLFYRDSGGIARREEVSLAETGVWTHYFVTYDGTDYKMYVNGELKRTKTDTITTIDSTVADIGSFKNGASAFYEGIIDDVRIYNTALTPEEVSAIYNLGQGNESSNNSEEKLFTGVIEKIDFLGLAQKERLSLSGRDYGAVLQDIQVTPRVWKDKEVSVIVQDIMSQAISPDLISTNNINTTTTTVERITLQNISVFDAIKQLAEFSGFFFYVDCNRDLHFEEKDITPSGLTFNNTNITGASFRTDDSQIFNKVTVYGDRILSGHEQYFTANGGSVFNLDYKPHNLTVSLSGTTNTIQQPGGVLNLDDPLSEDVKWLVDFQSQLFVMTSGAVAGDNIPTSGSDIMFTQYQKNTPIISVKPDAESQIAYGLKEKIMADKKIKTPEEASVRANAFLTEHKDPKIQGDIDVYGVVDVTPGETAVVNIPFHNIDNQTYTILSASYTFTQKRNLSDSVLRVSMNKKVQDFTDTTKDILLRLKQTEMSQVDAGVVTLQVDTGSIGVSGPEWYATRRDIGSAFYFNVTGHDVFDSPTSLLGDMRAGSIVQSGGF